MESLASLEREQIRLQREYSARRPMTGYNIAKRLNSIERRIKRLKNHKRWHFSKTAL